jgi:hypothetical protein
MMTWLAVSNLKTHGGADRFATLEAPYPSSSERHVDGIYSRLSQLKI